MKDFSFQRSVVLLLCAQLIAGCRSAADRSTSAEPPSAGGVVDVDDVIAQAAKANRPMVILIGEFGPHGADRTTYDLLDNLIELGAPNIKGHGSGTEQLALDLSISRNRATAARYHLARPPILVCLSPHGLIVSRDEGAITADLYVHRMDGLVQRGADLDAEFARLTALQPAEFKAPLSKETALAEFLLAHQNAREAIPFLTVLAASDQTATASRIDASVLLSRAHLWIGEPEKARHEAKALIATLGPAAPEAIAGGNLALGLQDSSAKRFALARREFQAAIDAAPDSAYAKQAQTSLAELPIESNR